MTNLNSTTCPALHTLTALDVESRYLSGVYFLQRGESGPIKIGRSCDIHKRVAKLQTGSPERLRLLLVLSGKPEDERRLHAWFARERLGGEWFRSDGEVAAFLATFARPSTTPKAESLGLSGRRVHERKDGRRVRRTTILMREDLAQRLDVLAARYGVDKTTIHEAALESYLRAHEAKEAAE